MSSESWVESQKYELFFWVNTWPYRSLPREEILEVRNGDAKWFLSSFMFDEISPNVYKNFEGTVLEVGCGPIGFFEKIKNIQVKGIDTLMQQYDQNLHFSTIGKINNYEYSNEPLQDIKEKYDFVCCSNVLDHTNDWKLFLEYLTKPLQMPKGELLLFTHCRYKSSPGHTQIFSPANLFECIDRLGLRFSLFKVLPDTSEHADYKCYARCSVKI